MYGSFKSVLLRILRVPPEPTDPLGAEGSLLVFRAAEGFLRYRRVAWAVQHAIAFAPAAGLAVAGLAVQASPEVPPATSTVVWVVDGVLWLLLGTKALLSWITLRLDYEMRWYKLTDRALRIREGVWKVREMTMTFANVQNLAIEQGPLQRLFGIADLRVQSAGGGGAKAGRPGATDLHSAYFRGVDNAPHLRDLVYARLQAAKDAGLGDPDDPHRQQPASAAPGLADALRLVRDEARKLREAAETS